MSAKRNLYGDNLGLTNEGKGVDVASQRLDDLDSAALTVIKSLSGKTGRPVPIADFGCGRGGFAKAAFRYTPLVDAVDSCDFSEEFKGLGINFRRADLSRDLEGRSQAYRVILCQRTIHYLRYPMAVDVCRKFRRALKAHGLLFISASGIGSELGQGYEHIDYGVGARFCKLSPAMQKKHGIVHPVCLFKLSELCEMLILAGLIIRKSWTSDFGNIKIIAEVE